MVIEIESVIVMVHICLSTHFYIVKLGAFTVLSTKVKLLLFSQLQRQFSSASSCKLTSQLDLKLQT